MRNSGTSKRGGCHKAQAWHEQGSKLEELLEEQGCSVKDAGWLRGVERHGAAMEFSKWLAGPCFSRLATACT